ncbi:FAD-binding oxidoreductase [uncultured Aquabacterium sp.]|uniref:FAD-binding oxidoreductase n=1 Tax=uncultured Aquabacterium sp. TaxID=158753 RepID=UPI0030D0A671
MRAMNAMRTPTPDPVPLLSALRQALGDAAVRCPSADEPLLAHLQDWRQRYRGMALAVVSPASTEEVAAVVRLCAAHGTGIVPQGGNTSLVGGAVPDESGQQIVLSLQRLNRVLDIDPLNLSMTVQAGCVLAQVQDAARAEGLLFPLSLASEGSCTIGGVLATNAGGTQVLRYGMARELCLGLEVVTAQGEIWRELKALRKDNSGYDLRDLVIGSEGTLGIVTAACLKLYPQPASCLAGLLRCPDIDAATALLRLARQHLDAELTGLEAMAAYPVALTHQHLPQMAAVAHALMPAALDGSAATNAVTTATTPPPAMLADAPWLVLLDTASPRPEAALRASLEALLAEALGQGLIDEALVSHNEAQYRAMWALREAIPMAEKLAGQMVKHDIGVPSSRIPAFLRATVPVLQQAFPGCQVVCFGHLGDGNLHFNVQGPPDMPTPAFLAAHEQAVNGIVYAQVQALSGTISAEHGIGRLKREALAEHQSPVATQWMRAIKAALDPAGTLNPRRLVP